MAGLLSVEFNWPVQIFSDLGIAYWKITSGVPIDSSDFVVGGATGLGIAPGKGMITHLVRDYTITRGRSSELDRVAAGQAVLTVDSPSAIFSPLNTSGSLSASLLPRIGVQISWNFLPDGGGAASIFKRFTGRLKSITNEPSVKGDRNTVLTCIDDFNELQRLETRSVLYQNVQSGCLVASLLNDAGYFSTCQAIDAGQDNYRYAHFDKRKLDEVLVDIERTEYGFMFVRGDGAFVFHNRHYRPTTLTATASYSNTMSGITYYRSDDSLYTSAEVSYTPRALKSQTTVWTLQSPLSIPGGTSASFFGNYIDPTTCGLAPALGVASPIIGAAGAPSACFYSTCTATGNATNSDMSSSFTVFGESFKMVASNSGSATNWLTGMTVTGCPLVTYEQSTVRALDTTACTQYGLRVLTYTGQSLINTAAKATDFSQFLVNRFKDPSNQDVVNMTVLNDMPAATRWQQILTRDLDDRISIDNANLGISNQDFFIGKLDERWDSGTNVHQVSWQLERATTMNVFIVDYSYIGGTCGVGY